ncbi:dentin sialophosphoprotein-like [Argopecten irradians]|uniref:dentin sialophosphoprotein-like n=1 Tax=Argopecten irradians TaxID=31199 RepID=UPI00371F3276
MKNDDDEIEQATKSKRRKSSKKKEKKKKNDGKDSESKAGKENDTDEVFVATNCENDENVVTAGQTARLENSNENGDETRPKVEEVNTLPRATRSRSSSERRSFKNLFRKSKLQKQRSLSTGGIQDNSENDCQVVKAISGDNVSPADQKTIGEFGMSDNLSGSADSRDKLKRMTVGEAKRVKSIVRKTPVSALSPMDNYTLKPTLEGVGKSESMESHSSSLPDLTHIESSIPFSKTDEDKKLYKRSISADMSRRKKGKEVNDAVSLLDKDADEKGEGEKAIGNETGPSETSPIVHSNDPILNLVNKSAPTDVLDDGVKSLKAMETPHSPVSKEQSSDTVQENRNRDSIPSTATYSDPIDAKQLEKNRKESFSNFINLSKTLPHLTDSSGVGLLERNSTEESRNESAPIPDTDVHPKGKIPVLFIPGKSKDKQDVIAETFQTPKAINNDKINDDDNRKEEKVTDPISKQSIKSLPVSKGSDNVTAWLTSSQDTTKREIRGLNQINSVGNTSEQKDTDAENSNTVSRERGRYVPEQKDTTRLSRSTYKSPRRFSGRSLPRSKAKEVKEKLSKDMEKRGDITAGKEYDKERNDSEVKEQKTKEDVQESEKENKRKDDIVSTPDIPNKSVVPLTKSSQGANNSASLWGKINKGNVAKPLVFTTGTQSELSDNEKRKDSKPISRSVQTSLESLKMDKKEDPTVNKSAKLSLRDTAEGFMKKSYLHNVEFAKEHGDKDDKATTSKDKTKRKSSRNSSSDSDNNMAIDISEIDDYSVFKTPESTPALKRKRLPPLSEIQTSEAEVQKDSDTPDSAPRLSGILKNNSGESVINPDYEKEEDKEDTTKPQKKLSLMDIITMKRRLSKHRKQAELSKKRPSKRSIKSRGKGDPKDDKAKPVDKKSEKSDKPDEQEVKVDTKVIIENETNISLSKLALLQETDIVDDVIDLNDDLPKKHIKFEPGDQPVASDEPLDEEPALPPTRRHLATRRESRMLEKRRKVITCCKQFIAFLFSHIGLCSLVVAYSILGGFIFQALEAPWEKKTRIHVKQEREGAINKIMQLAVELEMNKRSRDNFTAEVNTLLVNFQTEVYIATEMNGWNNKDEQSESELQWSFASSLLFAITVMTTIGYGHVAPKTNYGRIVTIGYAVLGIPLTLLCLTNIGDLMATGFRMLYAKVCCGVCCVLFSPTKRRLPDPEKGIEEEMVVQGETKSPGETIHVPTSLCILVMTAYILLGTLLFSFWEGWDVITGTYFSFITLSTIGFGDVVPGTAMDQWANEQKLVLCAMYLVFGLSLIAMCFNLVQEDVKAKCRWLGAKIGII